MSRTTVEMPQHARRRRRRGALRVIGLVVTAVVLFGASFVGALAARLQSNIHTVDIASLVGPPPAAPPTATAGTRAPDDPNAGRATNLLFLGSDERDGANGAIGGAADTFASDTAIVVHLAADRSRVELVSIPRDSLVDIPPCKAENGATSTPRHRAMFDEAFAIGWALGEDIATDVWANLAADRPIVRPDGTLSRGPGAALPTGHTSAPPGSSDAASAPAGPAPEATRTRQAGAEPFTAADTTAVCAG